jgi:glutamyl-tRNA synthetase
MSAAPVVGRLAPSPTGQLHLGHARTFVLAWCHVRSRGGRILLRLEDLDRERCRPDLVDGVLRDLTWLGLTWDGDVLLQSARRPALLESARRLLDAGLAYPCVCTRGDIRQALSAPHRGEGELPYPGICRGRFASLAQAERASGQTPALRFVVPPGDVEFEDGIFGHQRQDVARSVGDFVIARGDMPAYQLAVVEDDAFAGVSEVFRAEDLLGSTARQIVLSRALGRALPRWFHAPLVVDPSGRRLAKRADDLSLRALREAGVDPRAVIGWVAHSANLLPLEPVSADELARCFDLARSSRQPISVPDDITERLAALSRGVTSRAP